MCSEVRAVLNLVRDFVESRTGELDRVVFYGMKCCLDLYINAMRTMVPLGQPRSDSDGDICFVGSSKDFVKYKEQRDTDQKGGGSSDSERPRERDSIKEKDCTVGVEELRENAEVKSDLNLKGEVPSVLSQSKPGDTDDSDIYMSGDGVDSEQCSKCWKIIGKL